MARRFSAARVRDAGRLFAALGDPTRLGLVFALGASGPESITALSQTADVSRQAVTKHLHVLADAGLVRGSRHGRECIWELVPNRLVDARTYLDRIDVLWDETLERLRDFVEDD